MQKWNLSPIYPSTWATPIVGAKCAASECLGPRRIVRVRWPGGGGPERQSPGSPGRVAAGSFKRTVSNLRTPETARCRRRAAVRPAGAAAARPADPAAPAGMRRLAADTSARHPGSPPGACQWAGRAGCPREASPMTRDALEPRPAARLYVAERDCRKPSAPRTFVGPIPCRSAASSDNRPPLDQPTQIATRT